MRGTWKRLKGLTCPSSESNNRNLRTLAVDLETTFRLRGKLPAGARVVSESGIQSQKDVRLLEKRGSMGFWLERS